MQRAQKFRMIGLAGTALLAIAVPLGAAMAGPVGTSAPETGAGEAAKAENSSTAETEDTSENVSKPGNRAVGGSKRPAGSPARPGLPHLTGRTSRCGPELTAPQGIEAQTCVLAEDGLTWGRTYYRNRTGDRLRAVLTLLRPDGRTVQVNCEVPPGGVPGLCETPTAPTVHRGRLAYAAVAEIADAAGERLLLRSGSNSSAGGGGSDH
ncbi:hypothetical protein [Streptomyces sp. NRRL S-1813]|uniref:hypothetical protein n=1 Tax=Streptomyces sp. NRRL S-1813 TaxID=1463888 RepID=UPI0004C9FA88|nr:hypothetical protein [Streptomyces sp. NRRL S-1813]